MILGIGTDIIEIGSIRESIKRSKRFVQRVFTASEINYCEGKPNKYQHYAARFAAKEALMKAIKTGWDKGVQWKQIEIRNKAGGAPEIKAYGKTKEHLEEKGIRNIEVSLSHSERYAVAMVCVQ